MEERGDGGDRMREECEGLGTRPSYVALQLFLVVEEARNLDKRLYNTTKMTIAKASHRESYGMQ